MILSQSPRQKLLELLCILTGGLLILYSLVRIPFLPHSSSSPVALPPIPQLSADVYLVRLVGNPDALLTRKEWKPVAPASLTKLMTALVAEKLIPAKTPIVFSKEAKTIQEVGEKISPIPTEKQISKEAAIDLALVASANDAARALAQAAGRNLGGRNYAEGLSQFMIEMEKQREKLGMTHSHFENPVGLDAEGHVATAENLATLIEYIWYNHPLLLNRTRQNEITISTDNHTYIMESTNELLKEFPAILGGKTGFTDNAQGALILVYPTRLGRPAIIVLMKSPDRFGDGRKIINWIETNLN